MGDSRKYPYCIPQAAFWNFIGKECSVNWKSKGMGQITYDWNSEGNEGLLEVVDKIVKAQAN